MPKAYITEFTINVLGFMEEGKWCALGLEVDIIGHGGTFREACEDLKSLVDTQVDFALSTGRPSLIFHPADPAYFQLFAEIRQKKLAKKNLGSYESGGVSFAPFDDTSFDENKFGLVNA